MSRDRPALARTAAPAGPLLTAELRALDARLESAAARVLAAGDAEAVHDLRVALRRTRTVLEVGRAVLGRFRADEVRRALRDVQRATGALRDEEVLLELVASLGVAHPAVAAWLESRRRRERRLRRELVGRVRAGEVDRGRRLLDALLAFPIKPSRERRLSKLARRAVERARREVERRRHARPDDVEALHRLRIAVKRLRYTCDTFAGALPAHLTALAHEAARLQNRLGELHDVDMAIAAVRRARALPEPARGELLAALARTRARRAAAYVREAAASPVAGAASRAPFDQAVGTLSLRKISTR
jgi:CHAD domain-containing protein